MTKPRQKLPVSVQTGVSISLPLCGRRKRSTCERRHILKIPAATGPLNSYTVLLFDSTQQRREHLLGNIRLKIESSAFQREFLETSRQMRTATFAVWGTLFVVLQVRSSSVVFHNVTKFLSFLAAINFFLGISHLY